MVLDAVTSPHTRRNYSKAHNDLFRFSGGGTLSRAPVQLFPSRDPVRSARLMATMNCFNGRFGRGMMRPAVSGVERRWAGKSAHRSPRYTTRLEELSAVRA